MTTKSAEQLAKFSKVGTVGRSGNGRTYDDLTIDKEGKFHLSASKFYEMELATNSLDERIDPDDNSVYLVTCPGDSGRFMRMLKSERAKKKGRVFTNVKLAKDLRDRGMSGEAFQLEFMGSVETQKFYKISGLVEASAE